MKALQGNPGAGVGDVDLHQTLAVLLAGGVGSRLNVLVRRRAKPAVPFAGIYRIIDFTLSNIMNAGIERVGILTQYLPFSLSQHIARGEAWGLAGRHREARILPPHTGTRQSDWYKGTADAVYRNLSYIRRFDPSLVLILSGDHIYSMDYTAMIEYHLDQGADATLAVQKFPLKECSAFGTVHLDENMLVKGFDEKPAIPKTPWISLGIYVFGREILESLLEEVTGDGGGSDFAKHIFPEMLQRGQRVVAYPFEGYWQDVGTLQAYFESHMNLLSRETPLDVSGWDVRTNLEEERSSDRAPAYIAPGADVQGSLVSRGCKIRGRVRSSVLSPGVVVDEGAEVTESVIFHDAMIRSGSTLHRVIADKEILIHRDSQLGVELGEAKANKDFPDHLNSGLTVLGKGVIIGPNSKIGRNCCIGPGMNLAAADLRELGDGETFDEGVRR